MTTSLPPLPKKDPLAALPRVDRHKPKEPAVRASKATRWRAVVLVLVHILIGIHIVQWLLHGTTVTPVEPSEAGYLLDAGKLNAGFILFVVLILGTLVFGRWFCGWACHVVALQDLSAWLLGKLGLKPRPVRSRLLVLVPFVVAFHMFFEGQVKRWWRGIPNPTVQSEFLTTELWERFPGPLMGTLTLLVVGFLIVWWLGAKGFCTYGCPYGAFFAVADRFAPGRIRVNDSCNACGHCTSVCTSNVRVHEEVAIHRMVVDPSCMKCMDCVSVCPTDALSFGFTLPKPFAKSQQKIAARADFTWPEEITLAAIAWLSTVALRGAWFGEHVPFLMAVGLGVITAVLALLGYRLLRRPDVAFQQWSLKSNGQLARGGALAVLGIAAWLVLLADTGYVRWLEAAVDQRAAAVAPWQNREQRGIDLRLLDAGLQRVAAWSLLVDPEVHRKRGLALRDLAVIEGGGNGMEGQRLAAAEEQLRLAAAKMPRSIGVLLPLADVLNVQQKRAEAEVFLRRAAAIDPDNADVQRRLQALDAGKGR